MDDFDRDVYCIGGLPFDAVSSSETISRLRDAKFKKTTCFLTTPNLNFLALSQDDLSFRNSVIYSDLVIADGTPIVWIAKLLGIPITERVAGSTLFEILGQEQRRKMSVYFFGGPSGVAAEASKLINERSAGLTCVGYHSPGFGSVEEMSQQSIINNINSSSADFLVVALGAKKGQEWILKNLHKIKTPLVSHLGAVVNFEAKRLKRAPVSLQKIGLEWAWRIKEEPHLWRRYWNDGWFFLKTLATQVLPYAIWLRFNQRRLKQQSNISSIILNEGQEYSTIMVSGVMFGKVTTEVRSLMRLASSQNKSVRVDLSTAEYLDLGFFGLLLMLKKNLDKQGLRMEVVDVQPNVKKLLYWYGLSYLVK